MKIQVEVDSSRALPPLDFLAASLNKPLPPLLEEIGDLWVARMQQNFDEKQTPDGRPWTPLSETRLKITSGGSLMQLSGRLRRSITARFGSNFVRVGVLGGAANKRGIYHQYGYTTGKKSAVPGKKVPARQFIGLGKKDLADTAQVVQTYFLGQEQNR